MEVIHINVSVKTHATRMFLDPGNRLLAGFGIGRSEDEGWWCKLWPWLPAITGDFYGILHSINGALLVLITYN